MNAMTSLFSTSLFGEQFRWAHPERFSFLFLILVWVGIYIAFYFKQKNQLDSSFGKKIIPWLTQSISTTKRHWQFALQCLGAFFLIVALARPQLGQSSVEMKSQGVELMILADVSNSMLAEDVRPSRLEQMKIELEKLLDLMPGNKTGLIGFAGSAALLSPLTSDPSAMKLYIQSLDPIAVSSQGTNFESALTLAKESFERGGVTQGPSSRSTRVILVASDCEDHEENALKIAEELSKEGTKIITMAYGTEKGGTIPIRDRFGNLSGSKESKDGAPIITQVRGDFLKKLADTGQGEFYFTQFGGSHLREIVQEIESFEQSQFSSAFTTQYDEKFYYPLAFGLLLILGSLLFSDRNRRVHAWKGFYEIYK